MAETGRSQPHIEQLILSLENPTLGWWWLEMKKDGAWIKLKTVASSAAVVAEVSLHGGRFREEQKRLQLRDLNETKTQADEMFPRHALWFNTQVHEHRRKCGRLTFW